MTEEELAAEAKAKAEAAEAAAQAEADDALLEDDDFDKERALSTIRKQREAEKRLKAELAEARTKAQALDALEAAKADAEKSNAEKVTERDAKIAALEANIAERDARKDFDKKAEEAGFTDLDLAYLAAREQGLLGSRDPDTGEVSEHNLDRLAELFPALVGAESRVTVTTGDAGRRGRNKVASPGDTFNRLVRDAIRR